MTDLALPWNADEAMADLLLADGQLASEGGLKSAIVVSLFTDALARDDDALPDGAADRRGWWGDCAGLVEGDRIGSRLWLLARAKQLPIVRARAREYAHEALAWLVADGVAERVDVAADFPRPGWIALDVAVVRGRADTQRFHFAWSAL